MSDFLNPHLTRPAVRWTSGDALPAVEHTGPAAPLLVDSTTGRLLVDTEANLSADLSSIESKQDTTNAILTTTAADLAAVKTQLSTGTIAVTGGGGGGGSASAAYNATLPTYTSGASTTLQTDQNGRLITTGPELQTISTEVQAIDTKLPALSSGRVPVEVNNAASQVYNYTATGAVSANTTLISIDCATFREISVHVVAFGTTPALHAQASNDGTNWGNLPIYNPSTGGVTANGIFPGTANGQYSILLSNQKFFRVQMTTGQTSGTTTLVAYASQQATPKLYQQVSGSVSVTPVTNATIGISPNVAFGFATYHTLISAASTNATNVKASNGALGTCLLTNTSASWRYVKFFNLAVSPTPGTSTPVIQFPVPPNSSLDVSMSFAGLRFTTGISYAITSGSALLDTGSVGTGEVLVNLSYV